MRVECLNFGCTNVVVNKGTISRFGHKRLFPTSVDDVRIVMLVKGFRHRISLLLRLESAAITTNIWDFRA